MKSRNNILTKSQVQTETSQKKKIFKKKRHFSAEIGRAKITV